MASDVIERYHGGLCCGIRHIYDFCLVQKDAQRAHLAAIDSIISKEEVQYRDRGFTGDKKGTLSGKLFEIVLTDTQIEDMPVLVKGLKERNFKLVSRFRNNTGGWCNVLHRRPQNAIKSSPWHK